MTLEQLLDARERRGLRFLLAFRTFFVSTTLIAVLFVHATFWEFAVTAGLMGCILILNLWAFVLIKNSRHFQRVGIAGAVADIVICKGHDII